MARPGLVLAPRPNLTTNSSAILPIISISILAETQNDKDKFTGLTLPDTVARESEIWQGVLT